MKIEMQMYCYSLISSLWVQKTQCGYVIKMATKVVPNFSPPHKKTNHQLSIDKTPLKKKSQNPGVRPNHPVPRDQEEPQYKGMRSSYTDCSIIPPGLHSTPIRGLPWAYCFARGKKKVQGGHQALQDASREAHSGLTSQGY